MMKTQNERIQQLLAEGIVDARNKDIKNEDGGCAAYLAKKYTQLEAKYIPAFRVDHTLQQWIRENRDLVFGTLEDLEPQKLADFVLNPAALGRYLIEQLSEQMKYEQSFEDEAPDLEPEHDMRQRYRDYQLDEIGVC